MKARPYDLCNKIIVIVNVALFLGLDLFGDTENTVFMFEHGAMYPLAVLQGGEWYRMFSCMFLHFGVQHLANNMLILYFLGQNLEQVLGHVKYVLLYFLSGLGGSALSLYFMVRQQDYAVSAGASGAIFGVIGASIYIALRNKGRLGDLTSKRLVFMAALSLYYGFTATGVDNLAHIGGLISGFILAALLYHKQDLTSTNQDFASANQD